MNGKQFDVLCVGRLTVDILVKPADSVDFGVDAKRMDLTETSSGGGCLNVAMGLSKPGNKIEFIRKTRDDPYWYWSTRRAMAVFLWNPRESRFGKR